MTAENARGRAQLERRLKIDELETKLELDREKLERTSRVVSPARGQVAAGPERTMGGLVQRGGTGRLAARAQAEQGADDSEPPYESIVFVPAGRGEEDRGRQPRRGRPGDGQARGARVHPRPGRGHLRAARDQARHGGGAGASRAGRRVPEAVCARASCCGSMSSSTRHGERRRPRAGRGDPRPSESFPMVVLVRADAAAQDGDDVPGGDRGRASPR